MLTTVIASAGPDRNPGALATQTAEAAARRRAAREDSQKVEQRRGILILKKYGLSYKSFAYLLSFHRIALKLFA